MDSCGICAGGSSGIDPLLEEAECYDCNGDFNGTAIIDSCGICRGGLTGEIPLLDKADCFDCNGDFNGEAFIDSCGICAGGSTGLVAILDSTECAGNNIIEKPGMTVSIYPNPNQGLLVVDCALAGKVLFRMINSQGSIVLEKLVTNRSEIDTSVFPSGVYFIRLQNEELLVYEKIIIE